MFDYRFYYRRNLPHYQPERATLFVTFRLAGSIPSHIVREFADDHARKLANLREQPDSDGRNQRISEEQRRAFGKWDAVLHRMDCGPRWLEDSRIADIVVKALQHRNGKVIRLHAYCLMPNHAHIVFTPLPKLDGSMHSLSSIMHSLKLRTAREGNRVLGLNGEFWHHENYDHVVRDEAEYGRIMEYVVNNPVKAGLVQEWQDWPWNYIDAELALASIVPQVA